MSRRQMKPRKKVATRRRNASGTQATTDSESSFEHKLVKPFMLPFIRMQPRIHHGR